MADQRRATIGQLIWEYFFLEFTEGSGYWLDKDGKYIKDRRMLTKTEARKVADEVASHYGATRKSGVWG